MKLSYIKSSKVNMFLCLDSISNAYPEVFNTRLKQELSEVFTEEEIYTHKLINKRDYLKSNTLFSLNYDKFLKESPEYLEYWNKSLECLNKLESSLLEEEESFTQLLVSNFPFLKDKEYNVYISTVPLLGNYPLTNCLFISENSNAPLYLVMAQQVLWLSILDENINELSKFNVEPDRIPHIINHLLNKKEIWSELGQYTNHPLKNDSNIFPLEDNEKEFLSNLKMY